MADKDKIEGEGIDITLVESHALYGIDTEGDLPPSTPHLHNFMMRTNKEYRRSVNKRKWLSMFHDIIHRDWTSLKRILIVASSVFALYYYGIK